MQSEHPLTNLVVSEYKTQWLNETLEKLPAWPYSRIDELLPLSPDALQKLKH